MPVLGEQQGDQLGMDRIVGSEVAAKETADQAAVNGRVIAWEMNILQDRAHRFKIFLQLPDLGGLARSVQAFEND
jgi:hypothetical protein